MSVSQTDPQGISSHEFKPEHPRSRRVRTGESAPSLTSIPLYGHIERWEEETRPKICGGAFSNDPVDDFRERYNDNPKIYRADGVLTCSECEQPLNQIPHTHERCSLRFCSFYDHTEICELCFRKIFDRTLDGDGKGANTGPIKIDDLFLVVFPKALRHAALIDYMTEANMDEEPHSRCPIRDDVVISESRYIDVMQRFERCMKLGATAKDESAPKLDGAMKILLDDADWNAFWQARQTIDWETTRCPGCGATGAENLLPIDEELTGFDSFVKTSPLFCRNAVNKCHLAEPISQDKPNFLVCRRCKECVIFRTKAQLPVPSDFKDLVKLVNGEAFHAGDSLTSLPAGYQSRPSPLEIASITQWL